MVEVNYEALRAGASRLRQVGEQVQTAQQAGSTATGMSTTAFGILCSFFVPPAQALQRSALSSFRHSGEILDGAAAQLDACVASYEYTDDHVAQALRGLGGQI